MQSSHKLTEGAQDIHITFLFIFLDWYSYVELKQCLAEMRGLKLSSTTTHSLNMSNKIR